MLEQKSISQIIRFRLRTFLFVLLGTLFVLSLGVLLLAKDFVVKSSIEVGSALVNDRMEALEPPDQVARQITGVYLSAALLTLFQKGVPIPDLVVIQNLKADPVGRSIIITSVGDASLEGVSKELQHLIIDRTIKDRAAFVNGITKGFDIKIDSARRTQADLRNQSTAILSEIEANGARAETIRKQLEDYRTELSTKFQRAAPLKSQDERITVEAEIRELRDQISLLQALAKEVSTERSRAIRDLAEIRRQTEDQSKTIASTERDKQLLGETRITLPPSLIPLPLGPRRLFFLFGALAVSILAAFGTVILLHRFDK